MLLCSHEGYSVGKVSSSSFFYGEKEEVAANVCTGQQVPTSLLQELHQYLHSQEFQVVLTPLTCQTRSVTEQSHQKLVKNESGVK